MLDLCDQGPGDILDVGCFAGSLLSLASQENFPRQLGVDILPDQIAFAQREFGTPFRAFQTITSLRDLATLGLPFDYASCVEVIEHLKPDEIRTLFLGAAAALKPGTGRFVLSTPNYTSAWPVLEVALNRLSDVDYSEQHITRFNYFGLKSHLERIVPELPRLFTWELVTTTHWVSPFLGIFGVDAATRAGSAVSHTRWRMPFGSLLLFRLRRTMEPAPR